MTRFRTSILVLAACSSADPTTTPPTPAPPPPPPAPPHLDPSSRLLGGATWANTAGIDVMRWCPGDKELVALDDAGGLHRFAADGTARG
jgi:hypothetical protein